MILGYVGKWAIYPLPMTCARNLLAQGRGYRSRPQAREGLCRGGSRRPGRDQRRRHHGRRRLDPHPAQHHPQQGRPLRPLGSARGIRKRVIVPMASMLAIQVLISLAVLSLSGMMPEFAADLAIDPNWSASSRPSSMPSPRAWPLQRPGRSIRLGAARVCQSAILVAATGFRLQRRVGLRRDCGGRGLHRCRPGPDQSRLGAYPDPTRTPRLVQPCLLAKADRCADRLRRGRHHLSVPAVGHQLARRQPRWRLVLPWLAALLVEPLRPSSLDVAADGERPHAQHLEVDPLRAGARPAPRAGLVRLRLCHRPAHVHVLSGHLSL